MFVARHAARLGLLAAPMFLLQCSHGDSATATSSVSPPPASREHEQTQWSSWSPQTFARAEQEDRIILINVVATWCHWCHVMEEKTYADPEVAAMLAKDFVAIRIDSDARPDIAERYREWGWPATAFLTPKATPVTALRGYKNPEKFKRLLRELVAERDAGTLQQRAPEVTPPAEVDRELGPLLANATRQIDGLYDEKMGGWGQRQKYPFPAPLEHAIWRARAYGQAEWLEAAELTLTNEQKIIDPVWGGVYQYSLEGDWDHPHYEKITAIQAGAIENYALMARVTGDDKWLDPARQVAGYMRTMMRSPQGGFFTSQDADLRREGAPTVVGEEYYALDDAQRRELGMPRIDDNVYADLNGLMVRALVELYAASGDAADLAAARAAAEHVLSTHRADGGGFVHGVEDDRGGILYLRDQVAMGWGLLALYRATGDGVWLQEATAIGELLQARFEDTSGGGFWAHTEDPQAVGVFAQRRKPSEENGLAAVFLMELHRYSDGDGTLETPYAEAARRALVAVAQPELLREHGRIIGRVLLGLGSVQSQTVDVTVVGDEADERTHALHRAALALPEVRGIVERSRPGERYPDVGRAAVYFCTETACSSPVTGVEGMRGVAEAFLRDALPPSPDPGK